MSRAEIAPVEEVSGFRNRLQIALQHQLELKCVQYWAVLDLVKKPSVTFNGRGLVVEEPYGSKLLKAGLEVVQFGHAVEQAGKEETPGGSDLAWLIWSRAAAKRAAKQIPPVRRLLQTRDFSPQRQSEARLDYNFMLHSQKTKSTEQIHPFSGAYPKDVLDKIIVIRGPTPLTAEDAKKIPGNSHLKHDLIKSLT